MADYQRTSLALAGNTFAKAGPMDLLVTEVPGKEVVLAASGNLVLHDDFRARAVLGGGRLVVRQSDLPGLAATT